jgi:hypothetical protein
MHRQVDATRRSFPAQWRQFLERELHALVGSWRWYLEDVGRQRESREDYANEASKRTRMQLILRELGDDPAIAADRKELSRLDDQLKGMLRSGSFVGPRGEEERYPARHAWWLYGRPK